MAYDVARVRGLHPALGDGWMRFDAQAGMLIPDSVSTTVSTAFRGSAPNSASPHPSAQRSVAVLEAARQAVADLVNGDPGGVVLGADRSVLLTSLADASSSRAGIGYEVVVSRLDDEANIAPWLRAANRYGAKVKWAEVDIETGELPPWQWEGLITPPTRLVAMTSASATLGTVTDVGIVSKLVHDVGGLVVVDHTAAAPYRLLDIGEVDADVVEPVLLVLHQDGEGKRSVRRKVSLTPGKRNRIADLPASAESERIVLVLRGRYAGGEPLLWEATLPAKETTLEAVPGPYVPPPLTSAEGEEEDEEMLRRPAESSAAIATDPEDESEVEAADPDEPAAAEDPPG